MLVRIVAILTRMGTEYNELKQRQKVQLWPSPMPMLCRYLLQLTHASAEEADALFFELEQQGLTVFAAAMLQSLDRLRGRAEFILDISGALGTARGRSGVEKLRRGQRFPPCKHRKMGHPLSVLGLRAQKPGSPAT